MSDYITTTHPQYMGVAYSADFVDDVIEGNVRSHQFVPKAQDQSQMAYEAYVSRAAFFNVTERTTNMLLGALLRKPFTLSQEVPLNTTYATSSAFLQSCFYELLSGGRIGVMVDYGDEGPFLSMYEAENVTNWFSDAQGLTTVVLQEGYYAQDSKNPYKQVPAVQYRELFLDQDGFYAVRVWRQKSKKEWIVVEEIQPTVKGQRMSKIPFYFCNPVAADLDCVKPPLFSIAELNAQHFRTATDIAHAAHFIALPQPYLIGQFEGQDVGTHTSKAVGTFEVWQLTQGSQVGYMEFSGQGVQFLMNLEKSIEDKMITLGARLLVSRSGVESAEALSIRAGAETATLETITNALEACLNDALVDYSAWAGFTQPLTIKLNNDFVAKTYDSRVISALVQAFTAGAISLEQFLTSMYDGGVLASPNPEVVAQTGQNAPALDGDDVNDKDSSGSDISSNTTSL